MPTIGRNLINAGATLSKAADRKGDAHNPVGSFAAAAFDNLGDAVKGGTKAVMGADYAINGLKDGYGAIADKNNTFLGMPAQEVATRGLELAVQGAVVYTSAMIALEGAGQLVSAVGQTFEDAAKRARSVD